MPQLKPQAAPLQPRLAALTSVVDAFQSNPLWQDPCVEDTLANNYRVGGYQVDFVGGGHASQACSQSQLSTSYTAAAPAPSIQHEQVYHGQYAAYGGGQQTSRTQFHHGGEKRGTNTDNDQGNTRAGDERPTRQAPPQNLAPLPIDTASMGDHHRLGGVQFGGGASLAPQLYGASAAATQDHFGANSIKRQRVDDFELSLAGLGQPGLDAVPPMNNTAAHMGQSPQLHHHHHLPDMGPSSKSQRREDGAAPSMVGQAGMPVPAPRPRGPKLKFTANDDQLLVELKEQKNLTWKQIADFFPGRSSGTLQVRYCTKLKAKTTQWTEEMVSRLYMESFVVSDV